MGFWDALRGRTSPRQANLDSLFALPSAAMSLEAAMGLRATGTGSVCFRAAEGRASVATQREAAELVTFDGGDVDDALGTPAGASSGPTTRSRVDEYGYTWLSVDAADGDTASLVTDLHAVNSALEGQGFGPGLLCSVVGFADEAGARSYLVYLYKQGTFYPFCPTGPTSRDALRERQVRDVVASDLRIEPDTGRWMPLWGLTD